MLPISRTAQQMAQSMISELPGRYGEYRASWILWRGKLVYSDCADMDDRRAMWLWLKQKQEKEKANLPPVLPSSVIKPKVQEEKRERSFSLRTLFQVIGVPSDSATSSGFPSRATTPALMEYGRLDEAPIEEASTRFATPAASEQSSLLNGIHRYSVPYDVKTTEAVFVHVGVEAKRMVLLTRLV